MWKTKHAPELHSPVDLSLERRHFLTRRADQFREAQARMLLATTGWRASLAEIEAAARERHGHLPEAERSAIVRHALELQGVCQQPEEGDLIQAKNGPKLSPDQREQVRALIRRELEGNSQISASAVQRKMEEELGITLNAATFHKIYWQKVQSELCANGDDGADCEVPESQHPNGSVNHTPAAAPRTGHAVAAAPAEYLTMSPGADGKWNVRVDAAVSKAAALRLMQAIVAVLAEEEE